MGVLPHWPSRKQARISLSLADATMKARNTSRNPANSVLRPNLCDWGCVTKRMYAAWLILFRSTGRDLLRHPKVSVLARLDLSTYAAIIFRIASVCRQFRSALPEPRERQGMSSCHSLEVDLREGNDLTCRPVIGRVVYKAVFAVGVGLPGNARFQVVSEHDAENFLFDPGYLGIDRSDDLVIIQITWNEGRTAGQKKALYKAIVDGLGKAPGIRPWPRSGSPLRARA